MSNIYAQRIKALQTKLKENNMDFYILADADPHGSEYVHEYFKLRSAFSGFTGSNGTLLVGQDFAFLWTDGRYFIQAEKELEGSGIKMMKMGVPGCAMLTDVLADKSKGNALIGCNGKCFSTSMRSNIMNALKARNIECEFCYDSAYAEEILKEDKEYSGSVVFQGKPIRVLPSELVGSDISFNCFFLKREMEAKKCDVFISTALDTNMWFLNIRGADIPYCPVAYSYMVASREGVFLYVKKESVTPELKAYADNWGFALKDYDFFYVEITEHVRNKKVMGDCPSFNAYLMDLLYEVATEVIDSDGGLKEAQATKGNLEIEIMKDIYLKDSVAVCKFLYWLSEQKTGTITEYDAACKMDALRKEIPENRGLSFKTIAAYGPNAAMMHYETKKDSCALIEEGNMFLLDSGGQYDGGTTDVTRTVIIGTPTEKMREHYTLVARGMLALQNAVFKKGCTGVNLDILARQPIWEANLDYNCGTGHGIGYMLNVHEGPHGIRTKASATGKDVEIVEGMLVSDEPGIYLENEYGIRIENILACCVKHKNVNGTFLCFEPLTYVPLDMRLIQFELMTDREKEWLIKYQNDVYDKVSPYLTEEEKKWLMKHTRFLIK